MTNGAHQRQLGKRSPIGRGFDSFEKFISLSMLRPLLCYLSLAFKGFPKVMNRMRVSVYVCRNVNIFPGIESPIEKWATKKTRFMLETKNVGTSLYFPRMWKCVN